MKGKVDLTVAMKERRRGMGGDSVLSHSRVPLELKTGKMYRKLGTVEHRAQVEFLSCLAGDTFSPISITLHRVKTKN